VALSDFISTQCQLLRRVESGDRDEDGNAIPDEDAVDTLCDLQQVSAQEHQGELSDTTWMLFFGPDESVHAGDAVRIRDEEYELVGDPWRPKDFKGGFSHIQARARQTIGPGQEVGS
jgi:hypothetical protein